MVKGIFKYSDIFNSKIEKCSESIGINWVLFFNRFFLIKLQPQTIDSLLAKRIFLLNLIKANVGSNPANPGIAETVTSTLLRCLFI